MRHYSIVLLALILALYSMSSFAFGQSLSHERYRTEMDAWRSSTISAGITRDSLIVYGISSIGVALQSGGYTLAPLGGRRHTYAFVSEQYRPIGKHLYGTGRIGVILEGTQGRSWGDVYRPLGSNPYISGSRILGRYDRQTYDLEAAVATRPLGRWTLGLALGYELGDLSRQRDPRSCNSLLRYRLTPSATYALGDSHTLGLALYYQRRKEQLVGLTTVQDAPDLVYYLMRGMEQMAGSVGAYKGFSRQWTDHRFGGTLMHSYRTEAVASSLKGNYSYGTEYVYEALKYEPGRYHTYEFDIAWRGQLIRHATTHSIDASARFVSGKADEYLSELRTTHNPKTGVASQHWERVLTYGEQYRTKRMSLSLGYTFGWDDHALRQRTAYLGARLLLDAYRQAYTLPKSHLEYRHLVPTFVAGRSFALKAGQSLSLDGSIGYMLPLRSSLALSNHSHPYAMEVLHPYHAYNQQRHIDLSFSAQYQRSLRIAGADRALFVRFSSATSLVRFNYQRYTIGLTIGLYH